MLTKQQLDKKIRYIQNVVNTSHDNHVDGGRYSTENVEVEFIVGND